MAECTINDTELAREFGYDDDYVEANEEDSDQVINNIRSGQTVQPDLCSCNTGKLGFIRPIPTQLLTVYTDAANKIPVHIDLDSKHL